MKKKRGFITWKAPLENNFSSLIDFGSPVTIFELQELRQLTEKSLL